MTKIIVYFFCALIITSCRENVVTTTCDQFNRSNIKDLLKGDTLKTIMKLDEIISKEPKCIGAYLTRGDIYINLDSLSFAQKDFNQALALSNHNVYALYQLGIISSLMSDFSTSITYFKSAAEMKEKEGIIIDYNTDNLDISLDKYDVESIEIFYRLALSYYYNSNYRNSLTYMNTCIANNYHLADAYLYRGDILLRNKQLVEACNDFNMAVKQGNKIAVDYQRKYCN